MKGELNAAFGEALEKLGQHTTPEQLRRRGVRRVLSVHRADVSRLIEMAVNRTLMERTIGGLSEADRRFVIDEAHDRFNEGLRTIHDLQTSRAEVTADREELRSELEELRRGLEPQRGFEEQFEKQRAAREAELKALRLKIQARLLPIFDRLPPGGPTLRATALELLELFVSERDHALAAQRETLAGQVEQLERRISKLMKSLELTEQALERVANAKDLEFGIESIYRDVQGLNAGEGDSERKQQMLAVIFEANLKLQKLATTP